MALAENHGLWSDWNTVGTDFRRFADVTADEQRRIAAGETVASPVAIRDDLLWGSVLRFVDGVRPEALAAIFADYDGQYRYVPGMPVTRVLARRGALCRVHHRINPLTFVLPRAQQSWPSAIYDRLTYAYQLDEQVFPVTDDGAPGYAIRWTIPLETQVLGARENGEIMFTEKDRGTLVTYNNATEPFAYEQLQRLMPERLLRRFYLAAGRLARDYYIRTVEGFIEVATTLPEADIEHDIERMRASLAAS